MNDNTTDITNRFKTSRVEAIRFYDDLLNNYPGFERLQPLLNFIDTCNNKENKTTFG